MNVKRLMRHQVMTCRPDDSLNEAAQLMWDEACGSVAVVDENYRPVGFLTDRDICMASYTQGRHLSEVKVRTAMANALIVCNIEDDVDRAAEMMRDNALRRLPVIDSGGALVGLLSLDDIACESQRKLRGANDRNLARIVADVYGAICSKRCTRRHGTDAPRLSSPN